MTVRVVAIDDAADLRELVCMVLEIRGGFEVVGVAGDGAEAIEVCERERPDLVLLDLAMPVMDGLTALPLIRRASPESVVVMLSGFPADKAASSTLAAGAHAYLEKNNLATTLVPDLQEILARHADAGATPEG